MTFRLSSLFRASKYCHPLKARVLISLFFYLCGLIVRRRPEVSFSTPFSARPMKRSFGGTTWLLRWLSPQFPFYDQMSCCERRPTSVFKGVPHSSRFWFISCYFFRNSKGEAPMSHRYRARVSLPVPLSRFCSTTPVFVEAFPNFNSHCRTRVSLEQSLSPSPLTRERHRESYAKKLSRTPFPRGKSVCSVCGLHFLEFVVVLLFARYSEEKQT